MSLPTIVPPDDQPVRTSVRRRAPVENRPVHVLRRKSDNCSSDSEVTVKSKETNHVRSNSSDYRNVENRQSSINDQLRSSEPSPLGKDQGSIATGHQLYTQLAATPTCKRSPLVSPHNMIARLIKIRVIYCVLMPSLRLSSGVANLFSPCAKIFRHTNIHFFSLLTNV